MTQGRADGPGLVQAGLPPPRLCPVGSWRGGRIRALGDGTGTTGGALWAGYLDFYRASCPTRSRRATFDRLCGADDAMFGLLAVDDDGRGIGLANCVVHAPTWSRAAELLPRGPLRGPAARGATPGGPCSWRPRRPPRRGGRRLYWHTQQYNGRARSLYDQVGRPTSFVVYEM